MAFASPSPASSPSRLPAGAASSSLLRRAALAVLAALLLAGTVLVGAPDARAETPPANLGGFSPGFLVTDTVMFNGTSMTAAQVDTFLDDKGAACTAGGDGADCLKDLTMSTPQRAGTRYCDAIPAATTASAGRIINDVARACAINPQVILVMLQKEQGLITTRNATPKMLAQALGFGCPDFVGCDPRYAGFAQQIYNAGSRLQEYGDPARGYRYQAGRTYDIQYSPYAFCGYGEVAIFNRATAALYNYTPFTPTQATLDAGAGAVANDVCATYGNRNFFRTFSLWFGSPTGTPTDRYPMAAPWGKDPAAPFTDVPFGSSIFFTEIAWMQHAGLSSGWKESDGTYTFRPLQPINRDAMAAFLYRAAGEPAFAPPATSPFTDVTAQNSIFYKEITWAHAEGITLGWEDGTFRPLQPINRDAMAAFLYRSSGSPAITPPTTSPFTDVTAQNSIFYQQITWAHAEGISTGWSDGTYRPVTSIKRDAMAAFIYRNEVD